ncbi:MAG: ADOP family duplicated permease, partial [Acidobacteria bacterium]|nr:ADOP family duplicated permease [Acidobacteriota bacterium]
MPFPSILRLLWRRAAANPGLTLLSLLTLAVAVGATVAIFTVVNAVLLRPLPFPDSERLVLLRHAAPQLGPLNDLPMSDALHFLYAEQSRTLDGVVGFSDVAVGFTGPDNPQRVPAASVTASFFDVLRTPPRLGRPFTAEEDRPGAAPVVVLGDGLWRSRFGTDPGVVGRVVEIDRERVEIVGVMPPGFAFPRPETALWRPMGLDPENVRLGFFGLNGVARMADGASLEQVRAELGAMLSNLEELLPDQPGAPAMAREFRPLIVPFRTWVVGDIEATLWILLGAVGFLLLIACANVANLFLVRAEARHGEVAIRAALGESRGRLVASVLIESLALGVAGGLAALLLAQAMVRLLVRFGPRELPRLEEISIDANVLLFGLAVSLAAGLLFGLLPACRACALAASGHMTAGARGATSGRDRQLVRRGLVVVQIGLALTLLVGSGLAVRSFQRLAAVDPGFDPVDVLTFAVALPPRDYDTPDSRLDFYRQVIDRLRSLPGAVGAASSSALPLDGVLNSGGHRIEGRPLAEGEVPPMFAVRVVSPGYFDAMRIALVEGRVFDRLDEERDAPVVIVSRSLARAQWPGESALGKGTRMGDPPEAEGEAWPRIVGVVDDVHETALHEEPPEMAYYPLSSASFVAEGPWPMRYVVRAPNAAALAGPVREAVRELDAALPVFGVETLETRVERARGTR